LRDFVEVDEPTAKGTATGSSRAFSASRATIREAIAAAVRAATSFLNEHATRDELERNEGVWLADDQDVDGVADPVSGIVARRGGLGAAASPDVADAIVGLIAFATYVAKQLALRSRLRRIRREHAEPPFFDPNASTTEPGRP
jgi:CO/xanthine dehydrogenase Mo-binding subunit